MKSLQSTAETVRFRRCILDFGWGAGICLGVVLSWFIVLPDIGVFSLRQASLFAVLLPLAFGPLVSFFIAALLPWFFLALLAFVRGTAFAFVWCVLYGVFRPVGLIFCPLLMLAELFMTPILFFLWLHLLSGAPERALWILLLCIAFAALAGFISYRLVMPISAFLINGVLGCTVS